MQGAKRIVPPSVANGSRVALRVIAAKFHLGKLLMGVVIAGLVAIGALAFLTEDLSVAAPTVALCAGGLLVISAPQRRPLTHKKPSRRIRSNRRRRIRLALAARQPEQTGRRGQPVADHQPSALGGAGNTWRYGDGLGAISYGTKTLGCGDCAKRTTATES